tara:strand:+ start:1043 stop:1654 length:612 start_codon:yes stop_codon:yes gene_type:complete
MEYDFKVGGRFTNSNSVVCYITEVMTNYITYSSDKYIKKYQINKPSLKKRLDEGLYIDYKPKENNNIFVVEGLSEIRCENIQKLLFKNGYEWVATGKNVLITKKIYIEESTKKLYTGFSKSNHNYITVTYTELIKKFNNKNKTNETISKTKSVSNRETRAATGNPSKKGRIAIGSGYTGNRISSTPSKSRIRKFEIKFNVLSS